MAIPKQLMARARARAVLLLVGIGALAWGLKATLEGIGFVPAIAGEVHREFQAPDAKAATAVARSAAPLAVASVATRIGVSAGGMSCAAVAAAFCAGLAWWRHGVDARASSTSGGGRTALTRCQGLTTGIVGLPNIGKSTLFNALCDQGTAQAANFPFCTIDPNVGLAKVVDERLTQLAEMAKSEKVIHEFIEYVDIAGLVKGASKGEGLGNKFLGNIRNVDAIVHVVRCFEDEDITHVDGSVDPARDIETITLELIFSDMDQIEQRIQKLKKNIIAKVKNAKEEKEVLEKIQPVLLSGKPARSADLSDDEKELIAPLCLLTMKQVIYAANVSEEHLAQGNAFTKVVEKIAADDGDLCVIVSAQVEAELGTLDKAERVDYLESLDVQESGCETLVRETYKLLGLRTYFTCGPKESRAWTIRAGWLAPKAASVIHTDFEKGFIRAETIQYSDLLECGSEEKAKEKGLLRIEGKAYEVQEGDVLHFRLSC